MVAKESIKKELKNLAGKKGFTLSLVDQAIQEFNSGRLELDIGKDFYTRLELGEKLKRIRHCGDVLEIRKYDGGLSAIHNGNFCRMPVVCVACADKVSKRKKAFWKPRIEAAVKKEKYKDNETGEWIEGEPRFKYVYMITMTVKDSPNLQERLNNLVESKKAFRKRGQVRFSYCPFLKRRFLLEKGISKLKNGKYYKRLSTGGRVWISSKQLKTILNPIAFRKKDFGEWGKFGAAISSTEIVQHENGDVHAHEHVLGFTNEKINYRLYCPLLKKLALSDAGAVQRSGGYFIGERRIEKGTREYNSIFDPITMDWLFTADSDPVPLSKLSNEWKLSTNWESYNIDCEPISYSDWQKNKKIKGKEYEEFSSWVAEHAAEVLKYNSKLSEGLIKNAVSPQQYVSLIQRRGSRRLFNTFGAFRNIKDSLYFSDSELAWLDYQEWRDIQPYQVFRSDYKDGQYVSSQHDRQSLFNSSDPADNIRRKKLSEQAILVAGYRRVKAEALSCRDLPGESPADVEAFKLRLERFIDQERARMRDCLQFKWREKTTRGEAWRYRPPPF